MRGLLMKKTPVKSYNPKKLSAKNGPRPRVRPANDDAEPYYKIERFEDNTRESRVAAWHTHYDY